MSGFNRSADAAWTLAWLALALSACGGGSSAAGGAAPPPPPPPASADCAAANVLCVDDSAGSTQEYATIQAAVDAANPGDTVLVFPGDYAGFTVSRSGTSLRPVRIVASGSGVTVNSGGSSEGDGIRFQGVSHIAVEGFTIQTGAQSSRRINRCVSARGATADSPMRGNVVRAIRCVQPDGEGFYLSQFAEAVIENNVISSPGRNGQARQHGIYLANAGSDDTVIRGNTISGVTNAESEGIHLNGDLSIGGDGLISGLVIEGNRISSAGGNNAINMDGVQDALVQNNLVAASGRHALRAYAIDGAAGPRRMKIVNNTFVAGGGWAIKFSEDGGDHVVFNNILMGSVGSLAIGATLVSNANVFGGVMSDDSENTTINLATWRTRLGQDAASSSSTTAATFRNAGGGDFTLTSGSPARDAGVPSLGGVAAPARDLDGRARPAGSQFDVGAYES
jgi:Right handed beta helix region